MCLCTGFNYLLILFGQVAEKLRTGVTTPLALCQACLTRATGIETLNAFTLVTTGLAKKQASESSQRFEKGMHMICEDLVSVTFANIL